ncbi:hypothetical protein Pelo_19140 [Pelomyxa schiedti]|nr:hypothetical protein Pelo_19140 [Pelomyxa schiedti]
MWVSNSKWIVGLVSDVEIRVWRVVGGLMSGGGDDSVGVAEEQRFKTVEAVSLQFSPMCDDVIVVFSTCGWVKFIDLEASCRQRGQLIVRSRVECKYGVPCGILWRPDGSTCTLHYGDGPAIFLLREAATGVVLKLFPEFSNVVTVGSHHFFVTTRPDHTEFQVYSTENLCTASLWLVASTTHDNVKHCNATEIHVAVHDGATGFHVGDFSIPLSDPNAFNPACD